MGIAPAALSLFSSGDIFVPLTIDPATENRLNHVIFVAGRLRRGVTIRQAQSECDRVAAGMQQTYPEMRDWGIHLLTFRETFVSAQLETALLFLLAAVGFVLLIAGANIAADDPAEGPRARPRAAARDRTDDGRLRVELGDAAAAQRAAGRRDRVVRLVVGDGMAVASIGIGIGLLAALGLGRAISSLVYGLAPRPGHVCRSCRGSRDHGPRRLCVTGKTGRTGGSDYRAS